MLVNPGKVRADYTIMMIQLENTRSHKEVQTFDVVQNKALLFDCQ